METLIIASIETSKQQKMKCGIDEVCKLVQDSLESLDKTLQHLTDSDSVKSNSVSNRACLSIPKIIVVEMLPNNEELQPFKNKLVEEFNRLTQTFFAEMNSLKCDVLITGTPADKN